MEQLCFKVTRMHRLDKTSRIKAFADIAVNESLILKGLKILEGKAGGLFVSMPQEKSKDNRYFDTISPLTKKVREDISATVLDAYHLQ